MESRETLYEELEKIQDDLKAVRKSLECFTKIIENLKQREKLIRLKIDYYGKYHTDCSHWMKDCWTFQHCVCEEICPRNQLRRGRP